MTPLNIVGFAPEHYPVITDIRNAAMPKAPTTAEHLRDRDENEQSHLKHERWVAQWNDRVVGVGEYSQSVDLYHPQKFQISVYVYPEFQRHGIGSALYDHVVHQLRAFDPIGYQARTYEDSERSLAFLQHRGFVEDFRQWESHLDVMAFDARPYREREAFLLERGTRITSLAELDDNPARNQQIFDLERRTMRDIPSPESITMASDDLTTVEQERQFRRYAERVLQHPRYPREAFFVALHDHQCVGLSYSAVAQDNSLVDIEMTGVRREFRGQGIATALKMRGVVYAQEHGYRTVRTWNDTANQPILRINARMGFVQQAALIFFEKHL